MLEVLVGSVTLWRFIILLVQGALAWEFE